MWMVVLGLSHCIFPRMSSRFIQPLTSQQKHLFENLALCLAIYFASAISLDDEEAQAILGQDKCAHLLSFKTGLEQAFAQGDFLDRPTLTRLHILAIYLVYSIFLYYSDSKTRSKVVFRRRFESTTTAKGSGF